MIFFFYLLLFSYKIRSIAIIQCDPSFYFWRTVGIFSDHNIQSKPDELDRLLKLLTVLFDSPYLLFGTAIWAYVAYWLLAVSGFARVTVIN